MDIGDLQYLISAELLRKVRDSDIDLFNLDTTLCGVYSPADIRARNTHDTDVYHVQKESPLRRPLILGIELTLFLRVRSAAR